MKPDGLKQVNKHMTLSEAYRTGINLFHNGHGISSAMEAIGGMTDQSGCHRWAASDGYAHARRGIVSACFEFVKKV